MSDDDLDHPQLIVGRLPYRLADVPRGIIFPHKTSRSKKDKKSFEISDDPHLIEWVRKVYKEDLNQRTGLGLEEIQCGCFVDDSAMHAFEERPCVESLRQIINGPDASLIARILAAQTLNKLGIDESYDFEVYIPSYPKLDQYAYPLKYLVEATQKIDSEISWIGWHLNAEAIAKIIKLLSCRDNEVASLSAQLCAQHKVPGCEEALRKRLRRRQGPIKDFADALIRLAETSDDIELAAPHLFSEHQEQYERSPEVNINQYQAVLDHPNASISESFRRAMRNYLLSYESDENRLDQIWVEEFCATADASVISVLDDIVHRSKSYRARDYALEAIARIDPETGVKRILEELAKHPFLQGQEAISVLRKHADEAGIEKLFALRYGAQEIPPKNKLGNEDVRLLVERLGINGREWLAKNLDKFWQHAQILAHWLLNDLKIDQALADMYDAGIVHQPPKKLLSLMEASDDYYESEVIEAALRESELLTEYDCECGLAYPNHDFLVRRFANHSNGRLKPECQIQIYVQGGDPSGNEEDYYTVCFILDGQLYRFGARYEGDYYDSGSVVEALNAALEYRGCPERFIQIDTGSQDASIAFAQPETLLPIARRYALPLFGSFAKDE